MIQDESRHSPSREWAPEPVSDRYSALLAGGLVLSLIILAASLIASL